MSSAPPPGKSRWWFGGLVSERWAVVLGASVGTGAAIARAVASDPGLSVFGAHRGSHPEAAAGVVSDVQALGRQAVFYEGNAATPEGVELAVRALAEVAEPGSVQLMVHSLASASVGRLATGERRLVPRQIAKTFDVMTHSFIYWTQALLDHGLLAPGARLLALTNPLDESLLTDCGLITASKAALEVYVKALAIELGPQGYRVNMLKFPTVLTPAVEQVYGARLGDVVASHSRMHPAGRMCTVQEVARVVSWLSGPDAEWFNGATIDYSGAMMSGLVDLILGGES
ncbi:MAG: SDR family oxidoreductase [Proteobacteria bacterium]|nr:SDR family oxidoreductase [Pseudomonadota bacterium]